jgi:hypothetical protein
MENPKTDNLEPQPEENIKIEKKLKLLPRLGVLFLALLVSFLIIYLLRNIVPSIIPSDPVKDNEEVEESTQTPEALEKSPIEKLRSNENVGVSKIPEEILESEILLHTRDALLYSTSPLKESKIPILKEVHAFSVSNDKTKIAFIKSYGADGDSYFYIFNIEPNEVIQYSLEGVRQRDISWSPDDKYVLVNFGTSPDGITEVYLANTGKKVCSFSNNPLWLSKNEAFVDIFDYDAWPRPWGVGYAVGVSRINIGTCVQKDLLPATDKEDYRKVEIMDNDLVVRKTYVDEIEEWGLDRVGEEKSYISNNEQDIKEEYIKYDTDTMESTSFPNYEEVRDEKKNEIEKLFSDVLDIEGINVEENKEIEGWYLVEISTGSSIYEQEIFVVGPNNEIIFIDRNVLAEWF